jgi:hypothetical protein
MSTAALLPTQLYQINTGGPFPGVKRGRGVTFITNRRLVPRLRMSRSSVFSPLGAFMAKRDCFTSFHEA